MLNLCVTVSLVKTCCFSWAAWSLAADPQGPCSFNLSFVDIKTQEHGSSVSVTFIVSVNPDHLIVLIQTSPAWIYECMWFSYVQVALLGTLWSYLQSSQVQHLCTRGLPSHSNSRWLLKKVWEGEWSMSLYQTPHRYSAAIHVRMCM